MKGKELAASLIASLAIMVVVSAFLGEASVTDHNCEICSKLCDVYNPACFADCMRKYCDPPSSHSAGGGAAGADATNWAAPYKGWCVLCFGKLELYLTISISIIILNKI